VEIIREMKKGVKRVAVSEMVNWPNSSAKGRESAKIAAFWIFSLEPKSARA
jgi:hypothetical protein